jgi:hypothetical protein
MMELDMTQVQTQVTVSAKVPDYTNLVTVCLRCQAMLFWDQSCIPHLLAIGNENIVKCLEVGCMLAPTQASPEVQ